MRRRFPPWGPLAPPEGEDGVWDPMAPVNVTADGRIFRKTRFPVPGRADVSSEWMWVRVKTLDATEGVLTNDSAYTPELVRGARIRLRVIPRGSPLSGCSEAVFRRR